MVARRRLNLDSQKHAVCPKCGKDLVLSQPDGSPLLDGYVHMECPSCSDKVRYTVLRSSIPDTTLNIANVHKQHVSKKPFNFYIPMAIIIICSGLAIANMQGWISLPHLSFLDSGPSGGNIVGSWVAGDTVITFNANGTYTETLGGQIFDTGTYNLNGDKDTMTSRSGRTATDSYHISGNQLTGLIDGWGNLATYTRLSP